MNEATRQAYLRAMEIPQWQERQVEPLSALEPQLSKPEIALIVPETQVHPIIEIVPDAPPQRVEQADLSHCTWKELQQATAQCQQCGLSVSRIQPVFGVGNPQADLMLIGEAPGAEEDAKGEPFVGRSGQLLDLILAAVQLDREHIFIANILKCRPPQNRDPKPEEISACLPFLYRQVEWIQPKVILIIGRIAAQALLQTTDPISRLRGRVHQLEKYQIPLIVTYHPAYLLRNPIEKRKVWQDVREIHRLLQEC